jgi:hypothetical protein
MTNFACIYMIPPRVRILKESANTNVKTKVYKQHVIVFKLSLRFFFVFSFAILPLFPFIFLTKKKLEVVHTSFSFIHFLL